MGHKIAALGGLRSLGNGKVKTRQLGLILADPELRLPQPRRDYWHMYYRTG
jgi:hypothetical protein